MTTKTFKILRIELDTGTAAEREDLVASDAAVCIFINEEFYRTLIASPEHIRELVVGHLITEGVVETPESIEELEVEPLKAYVSLDRKVDLSTLGQGKADIITTACGASGTLPQGAQLESLWNASEMRVRAESIWGMARELHGRSGVFKATGGTHSAMLCSPEGEVYAYAGDVGRHNAVDKVVGMGVSQGRDLGGCVLVSSGRQSAEMVLKAARAGIPLVASVSGPLESGIRIAEATGVTLVCFVRGRRMNVYTHHRRVQP